MLKRYIFLRNSAKFRRRLTIRAKVKKHNRLLKGKRINQSLKSLSSKLNFNRKLTHFLNLKNKLRTKLSKVSTITKFPRYFYLLHSKINKNFESTNRAIYCSDAISIDTTSNTLLPSVNTTSSTVNMYHSKFMQTFNFNNVNNNTNIYPSPTSFNFRFNTFRPILTRQLNFYSDVTP